MSELEQRLRAALTEESEPVRPAPDLLPRVQDVVAADRRRRRTRRLLTAAGAVAVLAVAAVVASSTLTGAPFDLSQTRVRPMRGDAVSWWVLEVATTLVLVALALWLGPFIKRFGRAYAADVFHDNPLTGKSYLVLADIVYYLIFTAYILFTVNFQREFTWAPTVTPIQLQDSAVRIGGILLVMGVLHGVNIVLMPVLGRVFSLNRRLTAPTTTAPSQREAIGSDERR